MTNHNHADQADRRHHRTSRRHGPLVAVIALLTVLGATAATAVPADAQAEPEGTATHRAGDSRNDVSACLRYTNGSAYYSKPIFLQRWNGSSWANFRSGRTNSQGCATFVDAASRTYYRAVGYWTYCVPPNNWYYYGAGNYGYNGPPANRNVWLPSVVVGGPYWLSVC